MSSSSSAATTSSRSPSPLTPEAIDSYDPAAIQTDLDSWYLSSLQQPKPSGAQFPWEMTTSDFLTPRKSEDGQMLQLDELIEQHAYDDSPMSSLNSPPTYSSPALQSMHGIASSQASVDTPLSDFSRLSNNLLLSGPVSVTKPIPPPASLPRKQDPSSMNQRVVRPPKESCYNLPIMVPSIPEGGAKSRVETQVRVTVDLADTSSSRTRKQGKIDPDSQDILHLSATVTCASPPHNRVLSCTSCQTREAKRVAKKLAARVRPARSDSESADERHSKGKQIEDTTSIIQFNCAEILDFSMGSVVLPLRITCYCRHHREKVGFNVHFTMMDHQGRIIGTGSTRPIMITDDHKTAPSANTARQSEFANNLMSVDSEWSQVPGMAKEIPPEVRAPSKRKQDAIGKRPKPYDSAGKPNRVSREGSIASQSSPSNTFASLPMTRSPTPSVPQQMQSSDSMSSQPPPPLQYSSNGSDSSSPSILVTPLDRSPEINIPDPHQSEASHAPSPLSLPTTGPSVVMPTHPHPMPFMFFDPLQTQQNMSLQLPIIHRLIPNMGPTHGGIEVTVLGANFHPSLQLNCIFGDVAASSTQRWSDNTLVCVLPPRATAGVVAVWFDGFPKMLDQTSTHPSLFTYADESHRALMELALQVVGLKMTGKIEDAKNVAMRIVGGSDSSESQNGNNSNMMQLTSSVSTRDLRPLFLSCAGESENFESVLIDFLNVLDTPLDHQAPNSISTPKAISHTTSSGQTLLHLSAFMGFSSLVSFLVKHGIDLDARDRNGYTALHFAALAKSEASVRILMAADADKEIVNALGKTPAECASGMEEIFGDNTTEDDTDSDEEAQWGDAEEDSDLPIRRALAKRSSRRNLRRGARMVSGKSTSTITRSLDISRVATPPLPVTDTAEGSSEKAIGVDEKQTVSFIETIQRTLAQFPAAQGIIPTIPQLPLPQLPTLPGMPAVPWNLPQIPMVFPVYVPMMPGWPAFLGGDHDAGKHDGTRDNDAAKGVGAGAIRTAQELRATWERWFALAIATARQEDLPPPVYTPREVERETPSNESSQITDIRPIGYKMLSVPDQDIHTYGYRPGAKQAEKLKKKHDKMLLIFWLPILFMSMLWAIHSGLQFTYQTLKTVIPAKSPFVR
ncbi:Protein MGA2 [Termitomyces sp. J132]|nr:Protein MGA2 [Termitomyces sp. J132]